MNEIWKDIPNLAGLYQASDMGNIRSLDRVIPNKANKSGLQRTKGKMLSSCVNANGYCVVSIRHKTNYVHRLVCEAFLGEIPAGMTVNHKDGNKENNTFDNLEIVTYSQNHRHAFNVLHRTPSCLGKLNSNASKPIIQYNLSGEFLKSYPSAREAARQTGISHKHISSCCKGKRMTTGGFKWGFK